MVTTDVMTSLKYRCIGRTPLTVQVRNAQYATGVQDTVSLFGNLRVLSCSTHSFNIILLVSSDRKHTGWSLEMSLIHTPGGPMGPVGPGGPALIPGLGRAEWTGNSSGENDRNRRLNQKVEQVLIVPLSPSVGFFICLPSLTGPFKQQPAGHSGPVWSNMERKWKRPDQECNTLCSMATWLPTMHQDCQVVLALGIWMSQIHSTANTVLVESSESTCYENRLCSVTDLHPEKILHYGFDIYSRTTCFQSCWSSKWVTYCVLSVWTSCHFPFHCSFFYLNGEWKRVTKYSRWGVDALCHWSEVGEAWTLRNTKTVENSFRPWVHAVKFHLRILFLIPVRTYLKQFSIQNPTYLQMSIFSRRLKGVNVKI